MGQVGGNHRAAPLAETCKPMAGNSLDCLCLLAVPVGEKEANSRSKPETRGDFKALRVSVLSLKKNLKKKFPQHEIKFRFQLMLDSLGENPELLKLNQIFTPSRLFSYDKLTLNIIYWWLFLMSLTLRNFFKTFTLPHIYL